MLQDYKLKNYCSDQLNNFHEGMGWKGCVAHSTARSVQGFKFGLIFLNIRSQYFLFLFLFFFCLV